MEVENQTISIGLSASFNTFVYYIYSPFIIYTEFVNIMSLLLIVATAIALLILGP
jgi:hypothetical protein